MNDDYASDFGGDSDADFKLDLSQVGGEDEVLPLDEEELAALEKDEGDDDEEDDDDY